MRRALVLAVALALALPLACSTRHTDDTLPRDALLDPQTCAQCHADHVREWSGSMHAYASEDPVFVAMNKRGQRETNGALGDFCVKCHAPMAVREGATKDGSNLADLPAKLKGVTCFFCHTVDGVEGTHDAALHLGDGRTMLGAFSDPVANTAHHAAYSPLHDRNRVESASLCGTCHDIVTGHGAALERTFQEWKDSVFSHAPGGSTCGQCHMPQSKNLEPIAQAPNVFARRRHGHMLPGIDSALVPFPEVDAQKSALQSLLDTTLQSALCVSTNGAPPQIRVLLDNVGSGHAFPSGASQDRRVWVEVVAYAAGQIIYQSGVIADGTPLTQAPDPDLWLLRDCIFDEAGKEARMFWQAAQTEGNELPAQATFVQTDPRFYQTHIVQSFPRGGGALKQAPDRVTMRVRIQPMALEVLDDLIASGDLDPQIRAKMKTLDVGQGGAVEWTPATATDTYNEDRTIFACRSDSNFNVAADRFPAKDHARCKP